MSSETPNGEPVPHDAEGVSEEPTAPEEHDGPPLETEISPPSASDRVDDFADLLSGQPESLDPRFIPCDRVGWWITTGVVSGITFIGLMVTLIVTWPPGWWFLLVPGWGVIVGALLWGTLFWPQVVYRHTSYLVTPQGLEIRRGVVWKTVITMPKSRTQHTDVMQGPLQRHYGIATLTAHTAGTENASVALSGLTYERAMRIRAYLIRSTVADGV